MKKLILSLVSIATIALSSFGQAPEGFKYQAVVRDGANIILNNQAVGMQLTIQQGSIGGTAVYTETFATSTNAYGLVNLEIGTGTTTDDFSTIDWANGPYFMETAVDVTGGTSYVVMGTSQLMSVPYALYSKTAENVTNDAVDDADADPTNEMNTSVVLNGTNLETTDGNGTIVTDLSSLSGGGAGNWTLNGTDIYNSNTGNVGVGITTPLNALTVGSPDSLAVATIGHFGNFNDPKSAELRFAEDANYPDVCGINFQMNGSTNDLHLMGGCPTLDTIARFNRSGYSNMTNLRLGENILSNSAIPLTVDGNVQINGDITITGNIAKGGGTFRIDHPLDPENKYLVHSFVESPDMMNIFSGNITTDENGMATVQMPDYFEAANKDFRYQLTVIGTFAQAIIKEKINGNVFVIQTNEPNVEVSWAVTSVRADRYAEENRIVPVVEKELKGSYIHPELYGAGNDKSESAAQIKLEEQRKAESSSTDADGL